MFDILERRIEVSRPRGDGISLDWLRTVVDMADHHEETPIRFAVVGTTPDSVTCEIGVVRCDHRWDTPELNSATGIFDFSKRDREGADEFTAVLVIPTGLGCELGGHSGDGGAAARLIASCCDRLVTHPNVVNAADINELPENGMYVEGSVLSRLLMGTVTLQRVRSNRVLLLVDRHPEAFHEVAINAASAARAAMGLDLSEVVVLDKPVDMSAEFSESGRAVGRVSGIEGLLDAIGARAGDHDAVALSTLIQVPDSYHVDYFAERNGIGDVNPWGGVEAMLTHAVSLIHNVPSAHSPMMTSHDVLNLDVGVVDPRKAAEATSIAFLHCVLRGLHRAPRILRGMHSGPGLTSARDVSCLVIPDGCLGLPTLAALEQGIPVVAVWDRSCVARCKFSELPFGRGRLIRVSNYLEAAGAVSALRAGVAPDSVRRPMDRTRVVREEAQ